MCLAARWAVKYFEHYLYSQSFKLITEHQPLTWLKTMKSFKLLIDQMQFKLKSLAACIRMLIAYQEEGGM